jgi:hypothetical protein
MYVDSPETEKETKIQDLFSATSMIKPSYVMPTQSRNFKEGLIPIGIMPGYNMPIRVRKPKQRL